MISKYELVSKVMERKHLLSAAHDHRLRYLTRGPNTSCDLVNAIWNDDDNVKTWGTYFSRTTELLIRQKSIDWMGSGLYNIDIVGDVVNMLPILWFRKEFVRSYSSGNLSVAITFGYKGLLDTSDGPNIQIQDYHLHQMSQDVGK